MGDSENIFVNREKFGAELPLEDAKWDYILAPEEEDNLPEIEKIDQSELADLLEDSHIYSQLEEEVEEDTLEVIDEDDNNSQYDESSV